MSWQVLVMLQALFSALMIMQSRAMARSKQARKASLAINAVAFSTLYVAGLCMLPLISGVNFAVLSTHWQELLGAALCFNVSFLFMYKAAAYLESATISVLATSNALFTLVIAGIIFGEKLTPIQFVGTAILLPCIWYVTLLARKQHRLFRIKDLHDSAWLHGVGFVLLASLTLSLGHLTEKSLLGSIEVGSYIAFGWTMQVCIAWGMFALSGFRQSKVLRSPKIVQGSMILGLLRAATGLCFLFALKQSDNVSLLTVIANFRIVIVAVLAGWLLNERRYYYRKLAASAIAVLGLSIIFWN